MKLALLIFINKPEKTELLKKYINIFRQYILITLAYLLNIKLMPCKRHDIESTSVFQYSVNKTGHHDYQDESYSNIVSGFFLRIPKCVVLRVRD